MKRFSLFFLLLCAFCLSSVFAAKLPSAGQGIAYYKAGFPQVAKPLLLDEIASDPSTLTETCFYLGNIYFSDNQSDSAKMYYQKGVEANPANSLNAVGLTMLKIKSEPAVADVEFTNMLKLKQNKKNVDLYIAIANAYLFNDVLDKAEFYQAKAQSMKPKYAPVFVLKGDIAAAKKNVGDACANYEQAIYFDKKCKEAYIKYARVYKTVNAALAIEKLNTLKEQEPDFLLADREMADTYFSDNKFDKAAESYEAYLKSGNSSVIDLTKYAFILFLNGQYEKSLDITNKGLAKEPLNAVFNRLVMYNNVALERPAQALAAADVFFNKSIDPKFTSMDYELYGKALKASNNMASAITQYEKALQMDSSKVTLWKDLSDLYSSNSENLKALDAYTKYYNTLTEDKKTPDVSLTYGKMYYNVAGDTALHNPPALTKTYYLKADSLFALVAEKNPTSYLGNFYRARANSGLDPETTAGLAKPFYEETVALVLSKADPRYNSVLIEAYRYLTFYFLQKEDMSQSLAYCNKILALDPNNSFAKTVIAGINKVQAKKNPSKTKK